jgi:hypothetical protein
MKNDKSNLKNKILSDFKKFIKNSSFHKMNFNNKMVNKKVSEYIYLYFSDIIIKNDYVLIWSDNTSLLSAKSLGIKGYSNKYKNFTYRVINKIN